MDNKCIFCNMNDYIKENDLTYAIYDIYPVNTGHILIIPKRHVSDFFDISKDERESMFSLLDEVKEIIDEQYSPDGYNIGLNCGRGAGQTVMHVHMHLIPRYIGDIKDPRGGVRGVIPSKMKY